MGFFRKNSKIIFFISLAICFTASFFFLLLGIQKEKLAEKFIDRQIDLQIIVETVETIINWDDDFTEYHESYCDSLAYAIQILDKLPNVFAAVYDKDLNLVSERFADGNTTLFDPLASSDFIKAVRGNEYGNLPIVWKNNPGGISKRKMMTCFRWAFTAESINEPCLLVCAVSTYSIKSPAMDLFVGGILLIFTATFFVLMGSVIYIIHQIRLQIRSRKNV